MSCSRRGEVEVIAIRNCVAIVKELPKYLFLLSSPCYQCLHNCYVFLAISDDMTWRNRNVLNCSNMS
jgi:hypothetical protein